jgi:hypothetical protein
MNDDTNERWDEDPGWQLSWRVLLFFVPGAIPRAAKQAGDDALTALRLVFTSFVMAVVLFGVVLFFLPTDDQVSPWPWVVALLVIAVVCVVASRLAERPLDCTSDFTLASTFRIRFFKRMAFAEAIALFAFVFRFTTNVRWIYYLGAAISLARMLTEAPTPAALVRDQDELSANGCSRSLVAALRHPRPG